MLNARDPQLDRAMDLLKGITLFTQRAPVPDKRWPRARRWPPSERVTITHHASRSHVPDSVRPATSPTDHASPRLRDLV